VLSGEEQIRGAVTRETVVRRINEWSRPLAEGERADHECFEAPEFLVAIMFALRRQAGDSETADIARTKPARGLSTATAPRIMGGADFRAPNSGAAPS
jgi:hypothetical protein